MSNNTTKKTVRFYSKEENKELMPFIKGGVQPTKESLANFCKKHNRNFGSVQVRIYTMRKNNKIKKNLVKGDIMPKASLKPTMKDKTAVNLSKGEFKIPISNWNVSNENGQFYFIVKF
jgi:hypothetical protein